MKSAVEALKLGAANYVLKPFNNDELRLVVSRALGVRSLEKENERLKRKVSTNLHFGLFVGDGFTPLGDFLQSDLFDASLNLFTSQRPAIINSRGRASIFTIYPMQIRFFYIFNLHKYYQNFL